MNKLLYSFVLILGTLPLAWGSCPLLTHDDPSIEREFKNVCDAIANSGGSTSGLISNTQTFSTTASSATLNTGFVKTGFKVSITPSVATDSITVTGSCEFANNKPNTGGAFWTLEANGSNLGGTNGFGGCNSGQASDWSIQCPMPIHFIHSPNTTSAVTYEIYIKASSGVTGTLNPSGVTCFLEAFEISK